MIYPTFDVSKFISGGDFKELVGDLLESGGTFPITEEVHEKIVKMLMADKDDVVSAIIFEMSQKIQHWAFTEDFNKLVSQQVDRYLETRGLIRPQLIKQQEF